MKTNLKILFVYPKYPNTFWSFKHALKFVFKKATNPPLGLLTVAAMVPGTWKKKLIDMNVTTLNDKDLAWADYVFITAMSVQRESVKEIIARCNKIGVKIVAGGPLFTTGHDEFTGIDHFVLNEAEITLPMFLEDLKNGNSQYIYTSKEWASLKNTPIPLWKLIKTNNYATMNIQYSRGCPYNCEFCDITQLYGRNPRTKSKDQVIAELESIYSSGWRGDVFFVDDNFIGNKGKLKTEILPAIIRWSKRKNHPFHFYTQTSVELADDDILLRMMADAGFNTVFVGIETPEENSLLECSKFHNKNRDLIASVKKIQRFGLQVQAGFIVGFDSDPLTIFERQIKFIQKSGIVTAMVGLLNALRGTKLYHRLKTENRLLQNNFKDNTNNADCSINFTPKMNYDALINGYKSIITTIYAPKHYYARVKTFLKEYKPLRKKTYKLNFSYILAFIRSSVLLGIVGKERLYYWRLFFWTMFRKPNLILEAVTFSIYGFHFRKVFEKF